MKIFITGLSNSGKTTVFNALTGQSVETTAYPTAGGEPSTGVVKVPDERLDRLSEAFRPKKTTHSTVQYTDYIGLTKGDMKQNGRVFEHIKDADALLHVVRAFRDDAVPHPFHGPDPLRDVGTVEEELIFGDLEFVERRLNMMELSEKRGKKPDGAERKALSRCREALEGGKPLRDVSFTAGEERSLGHMQFLTLKPELVAINIDERDLNTKEAAGIEKAVAGFYAAGAPVSVLSLSGKVEMEIAALSVAERGPFLEALGIKEPALEKLIRTSYGLLGLISFFTVVGGEVRAWPVRKGTDALTAAGKIHSDIQRGFIKAEVLSFEDFVKTGGMAGAREKGLLRLEGKTYVVKDGDIINFRFNV